MFFRDAPPLPDDGIYRTILLVLVVSLIAGACLTLVGELVFHSRAMAQAGAGLALVSGVVYFFFRWLGRREARRRAGGKDRSVPGRRDRGSGPRA